MKKMASIFVFMFFLFFTSCFSEFPSGENEEFFSESLMNEIINVSKEARSLLEKNGFVVTPGKEKEIFDIYKKCKENNQPIYITTDAILHTSHIFFDYLLRILEIEKTYDLLNKLTDRMLSLSIQQYDEAKNELVKETARLNIGFFLVAKKHFCPECEVGYGLNEIVSKEIKNIEDHEGFKFRELLHFIKNPSLNETPYAFEDYSQFTPRGHYTRNDLFKKYFRVMMWYGRIDFKLKPGGTEYSVEHGKKMTLQAILMTDALMSDEKAYRLWKQIYEPTVYFVGKTDDLSVEDYREILSKTFPSKGSVDKYGNEVRLSEFIESALRLYSSEILSGAAFAEEGGLSTTKGFRFMGQRFIPDSYIFQQLVYGITVRDKDKERLLEFRYKGTGNPFTMEIIERVGPVRAFPRGLDILAVLGSKRALEILETMGDTEYTDYGEQIKKLQEEFSIKSEDEWKQNLYWSWLYSLIPLIEEKEDRNQPEFMKNTAWKDKKIHTVLGSWTELRHDTILYAKQSYTLVARTTFQRPEMTYGYVEPYPEVYDRIGEMMRNLRHILISQNIAVSGVQEKIIEFEEFLKKLSLISEKELKGEELSEEEYQLIRNIGFTLESLKEFPRWIKEKIVSGTDERMDVIADVHTEPNTHKVLEEGVGSPFNIYVVIHDEKGRRVCRGAVFSYYEFKHPMRDRLTDEKWQEIGEKDERPPQPCWVKTFIAK